MVLRTLTVTLCVGFLFISLSSVLCLSSALVVPSFQQRPQQSRITLKSGYVPATEHMGISLCCEMPTGTVIVEHHWPLLTQRASAAPSVSVDCLPREVQSTVSATLTVA